MISDSGCMTTELFVEWLEHFQVFVKSSQEDPVLLILDNHVSHCSLEVMDTSRKYNICLVSLPPHASHKLQPLDVVFFGPLKTAYSVECYNWIAGHPGRPITHYQVAGLFRAAYNRVGNLERPIAAFKATGIYPFRPTIFDEVDLLPFDDTDRLLDEADPSTSVPATRSSSPAHTVTGDPVTRAATPLGLPALRISPAHNVTHDLLPTPATPPDQSMGRFQFQLYIGQCLFHSRARNSNNKPREVAGGTNLQEFKRSITCSHDPICMELKSCLLRFVQDKT